jgi:hypothetical protein
MDNKQNVAAIYFKSKSMFSKLFQQLEEKVSYQKRQKDIPFFFEIKTEKTILLQEDDYCNNLAFVLNQNDVRGKNILVY